jgi:hypothetical protein
MEFLEITSLEETYLLSIKRLNCLPLKSVVAHKLLILAVVIESIEARLRVTIVYSESGRQSYSMIQRMLK